VFDDTETGAPQVPIIATTVSQAMLSVYNNTSSMIATAPDLRERSIPFTGIGTARIHVPSTGGEVFPKSNDHAGLQGLDPSFAIMDEIGFQPQEAWSAVRQASGKRSQSLILGIGTPGVDHENALYAVRERFTLQGIDRFHYREWAADEGCRADDREQWRKANPAMVSGFLRETALESLYEEFAGGARFRIFHLGQWVDGYESWLGEDGARVWADCEDGYSLKPGEPTWIGVDAAQTRDTTAVVAVQFRPDGRLHAEAHFWVPTKDEPTDINLVMAHIRGLANKYKVGAVAYDPRYMEWPAKVLYDEGIPMMEVPQSTERMTGVYGDLHDAIRQGEITHGKDPMFARHVLSAQARFNERGFMLKKDSPGGHIDACVALALALYMVRNKKKRYPVVVL
jgi:phage terminase large subunit-like protein